MAFYFYIIRSEVDGSYYKGHTDDLEDRIERHNRGRSEFTKSKRPWKLVHVEEFASRSEAAKRESFLKSPEGLRDWQELRNKLDSNHNSERGAAR